jgi:hypothetical protein
LKPVWYSTHAHEAKYIGVLRQLRGAFFHHVPLGALSNHGRYVCMYSKDVPRVERANTIAHKPIGSYNRSGVDAKRVLSLQ